MNIKGYFCNYRVLQLRILIIIKMEFVFKVKINSHDGIIMIFVHCVLKNMSI